MATTNPRQRNARGEGGRLRLEIVQAATRLIDTGTNPLSLRAIARQAGVAGPSLYDHFTGVDAIRNAVIRSCYDDLSERIGSAQRDLAGPDERLEATCRAYVAYGAEFPHRYALVFRGERDAEQRDAVGDRGAAALQTLVDAITACNAAGVSASDDPYGDAVAVWSAIHGLTTLRATRPHFERLQSDELMRSIIRRLARITPAERPIHP